MEDVKINKSKHFSVHPAVISVWSAVIALGHLLPTIPIYGTGGTFSLSTVLYPLSGIFFGPLGGALCSAAGGFIGSLIAPYTAWMGLGTFIVGTTTAFTAGCAAWGKFPPVAVSSTGSIIINGGIIVYLVGTILWFTQEIGRSVISFPLIFYGVGFVFLITAVIFARRMFESKNKWIKFPAVWLCAFSGLIGGATIGNFFSLVLYKQPKEVWLLLTITAPIERAVFASVAMLVGVPLLSGLNKIGIFMGPQGGTYEN
ncbi:ECF transporter S component [Treponema sp. R6D11]